MTSNPRAVTEGKHGFYRLRLSSEIQIGPGDNDPEASVVPVEGELTFGDLRRNGEEVVGTLNAYYFPFIGNLEEDELWDLFDGIEGQLEAAAGLIAQHLDLDPPDSLFFLTRIAIEPDHRRQDLGLAMARQAMRLLGDGCRFAILKPFPLQYEDTRFEDDDPLDNDPDFEPARLAIARHWARLGFTWLANSGYMVLEHPAIWEPVQSGHYLDVSGEIPAYKPRGYDWDLSTPHPPYGRAMTVTATIHLPRKTDH